MFAYVTSEFANLLDQINTGLTDVFEAVYSNPLELDILVALVAVGIFFTYKTRVVQFRYFGRMVKTVMGSRQGREGGISSFQAFTIGLASRVGTGNIAGVAIAIVVGGPGAIFWMWIIAFLGMATAFVEAVLAQLYKVPAGDKSFRGGPAYYLARGLNAPGWGKCFAVLLIFAFGFSFNMVQTNTIASVSYASLGIDPWATALILLVITIPVVFGGLRPIARVLEYVAPIMALVYMIFAVVILVLNVTAIPGAIWSIISAAFGFGPIAGGIMGGIMVAMANGAKRGLFSNEAGMGSAPNAAATATVRHPVQQGFIQSLAVFVDTMLVCTATACIVLFGGHYQPGVEGAKGAELTVLSMQSALGEWAAWPMLIIVLVFGYSTVLGNYTYAEINFSFLRGMKASAAPLKCLVVVSVGLGCMLKLDSVWALADIASALMALINIGAIVFLAKWALGVLHDYEAQMKANPGATEVPRFVATDNPHLPGKLDTEVWTGDNLPVGEKNEA